MNKIWDVINVAAILKLKTCKCLVVYKRNMSINRSLQMVFSSMNS